MHAILTALALTCAGLAHAGDLFEGGKIRPLAKGDVIPAGDTVGGYAVYPGEGKWVFEEGRTDVTSGSQTVPIGFVRSSQFEGNTMFAGLIVVANLRTTMSGLNTAPPCSTGALHVRNKGNANRGNCLTITPAMIRADGQQFLVFAIRTVNTGSNGTFYAPEVAINPALLGFRGSAVNDWTEATVAKNPRKAAFVERLKKWGEALQDAHALAFDGQPAAVAFASMPSWRTLLPVPDALKDTKYSQAFLSVTEHVKDRPAQAALAFSHIGDFRTRWAFTDSRETAADAERSALLECEKDRPATAMPCQIYRAESPGKN